MEDSKKPWKSKTLWLALISAVAAFIPSVNAMIVAHPDGYVGIVSALFALLRLVSKDKISIE